MASIATCPQCARQLALPESATSADHAECPLCAATFSLANVVQLAIPPARIICLGESTAEPVSTEFDNMPVELEPNEVETAAEPTAEVSTDPALTSLPSWEARLKRAIEEESTELSSAADDPTKTFTPSSDTTITASQFDQEDFDFEVENNDVDPYQPESPEPETYAPEPEVVAEDNASIEAEPEQQFEPEIEPPEQVVATPSVSAEAPTSDDHAALAAKLHTTSRKRSSGRSWLTVAVLMICTSVVGTFLGLVALIWLRGPSADFVGLANYLPEAMLPASSQSSEDFVIVPPTEPSNSLTQQSSPPAEEQSQPTDTLPAVDQLAESTAPADEGILQDPEVQPATSEQPLADPPAEPSIPLNQFSQLVSLANGAYPHFIESDLANHTATKGQAYMAMCKLAEQFDFVHHQGLPPEAQTEVQSGQALFQQLFNNSDINNDLAKVASLWWEHQGRANQGILLTGTVQDTQPIQGGSLCHLVPGGNQALAAIPVLINRPNVAVGSRLGIVGRILPQDDPALAGLGVDLSQAVVSLQIYDLP